MKIHFIIQSLVAGGAERVLVIIANYLSAKGHDVSIINYFEKNEYILAKNVKVIILDGQSKRLNNLKNLLRFYRKKNNRPDIIISFITLNNLTSILAAKIYGIKVIASEHNSFNLVQSPKFLTYFTQRLVYPLANKITVLTSHDIPYYRKRFCNVMVMPNPVTFTPVNSINPNKNKDIIVAGNLDRYHQKGFDNLIRFITPILKKNKSWNLKIVGKGDIGMPYLKNLVNQEKIHKQISFLGYSNNVKELLHNSEIFILSSRYEGLPMVLLEAMSQGVACISYNCVTGPSEIITNGENGILIENQNEEKMVLAIEKIIQSKDLRDSLAKNAFKSLSNFSTEKIGHKWEQLLKELTHH